MSLLLVASASGGELPAPYVAARDKLVSDLAALATWCAKSRLYLDREETYEFVLRLDPDHDEARKQLKYIFRDGQWLRSEYVQAHNLSNAAHAEYVKRCAAIVRAFADAAVAELAREGDGCPGETRRRILDDVLAADPDHEAARAMAGYVREGGGWVTVEVRRLNERRRQLKSTAHDALIALPETRLDGAAVENKFVEVYGQFGCDELCRFANVATATLRFFDACFNAEAKPRPKLTLHMAESAKEFEVYLRALKRVGGDGTIRFGGAVRAPQEIVVYAPDVAAGVEQAVRHTAALLLERDFGVTPDVGWVREGVSLYVTALLVGVPRHAIMLGRGAEFGDRHLGDAMAEPGADWYALAREYVRSRLAPPMADVVAKSATAMGPADLLFSSVFATYLFEVHEGKLKELLAAGADRLRSLDAIAKVLGLETRELDADFKEWLASRE